MRTLWLRPNKNAVSPVIGTILMVAITVVLAAVLYVMVTGLVTNPGETKPTVSMSIGNFQGLATTATITSVSTSTLDVSTLVFQVVAGNGTIYFSGAEGTGTAVNGVVVTVNYNDATNDGKVGPDDNIGISVAQQSDLTQIHGTTFKVLEGSTVLGTAGIP